jgi:hypothetical protein
LKLSQTFQPNPFHRYTLPEGTPVHSAKFGRTQVDIWPRAGVRAIYRDGAHVGDWPEFGYSFAVHDELSGFAATFEAAKAEGEFYARISSANGRYELGGRRHHAMTPEAARAAVEATEADRAALMARHPYTPAEVAKLKASRHHADILEPLSDAERARRVAKLL